MNAALAPLKAVARLSTPGIGAPLLTVPPGPGGAAAFTNGYRLRLPAKIGGHGQFEDNLIKAAGLCPTHDRRRLSASFLLSLPRGLPSDQPPPLYPRRALIMVLPSEAGLSAT